MMPLDFLLGWGQVSPITLKYLLQEGLWGQQSSSVLRKLRKWLTPDQGAKSLSTGEAIEVLGPRSDLKPRLLPFALLPPPLLSYHRVLLLLYTRGVG